MEPTFIPSIKYWLVKNDPDDYHGNFTQITFINYFKTKLLPNLHRPSIIVMDNAKYHRYYGEKYVNPRSARKQWLKDYLDEQGRQV